MHGGVASTAIGGVLRSGGSGVVLGSSAHAVWVAVAGSVVAITTNDATRLPLGVEIGVGAATGPFQFIEHGAPVEIGHNRISAGGLTIEVARWWDPRPAIPPTTVRDLAAAIESLPAAIPGIDEHDVRVGLATGSAGEVLAAAGEMLGLGAGLTPEGDDYLAGACAGLWSLGRAVGSARTAALLEELSAPLVELAGRRTTTFSAALIECALRGQMAAPAGRFVRALAGRGGVEGALHDLLRVGQSSGPALAAGIVLGSQALIALETG